MGDTSDGSSSAAQSALEMDNPENRGFWGRIIDVLTPPGGDETGSVQEPVGAQQSAFPMPGIVNLRRMRVEEVAIPKADIVSVPFNIRKDELYAVFKESCGPQAISQILVRLMLNIFTSKVNFQLKYLNKVR